MHDLRLYRIALVPAFLAIFVAAFALENRPPPVTTPLSPQAFDGDRAHGGDARRPPRNSLRELVAAFPEREPGSVAEEQLGERVARELDAQGFRVTRRTRQADSGPGRASLTTVSGVRPGISSRRVVVLAHRDAAASPATAELSATAALLEIARVSRVRDLRRTLELVSTSGGSSGAAGARGRGAPRVPRRCGQARPRSRLAGRQPPEEHVADRGNALGRPEPLIAERLPRAEVDQGAHERAVLGRDVERPRAASTSARSDASNASRSSATRGCTSLSRRIARSAGAPRS